MDEPRQPDDDADNSVAGRIARALSQQIINGGLEPGTRLRQDNVANEFGASHVPVREAFRKLESSGLLVSEPRRGVRVAALEPSAILEVTEMRAALEALALRHAASSLRSEDFAAAWQAIKRAEASSDIVVWEQANRDFHRSIVAPCRLPRLLRTIDELHQASARFLYATWSTLDWQLRSDQEHRGILAALEHGTVDRAAKRLSAHITAAGRALVARLKAQRS